MIQRILLSGAVLLGLAACTEPSQALHSGSRGTPAYQGTGSNFVAPDWKPGDERSWSQALKVRAQRGQNEYSKLY